MAILVALAERDGHQVQVYDENAARAQIGGSIAFVTRLKEKEADPLFFDEDD